MGYNNCGIKWNNELVKTEIEKVMVSLNIQRMPSHKEIKLINKNTKLSNAICKSGGFYIWAEKLGIEVKNCETKTGKGFEKIAGEIITQKWYEVKQMTTKYPYDLLVNNHIRVDVKVAKPYSCHGNRVHTVGINKKYSTCDLYVIFALDELDNIERMFIIPGMELKQTSLNFGADSKYNIYLDRWDYFEKFDKFYEQLDLEVKPWVERNVGVLKSLNI